MKTEEKDFLIKICRFCINKYQVINSAPLMSSFIYELCKKSEMDVPAVEGILHVEVNGRILQYSHCFNVFNSTIIDASVYQFALMNKSIENIFPLFVVGDAPETLDYSILHEIRKGSRTTFSSNLIESTLKAAGSQEQIELKRFSLEEDAKKQNLFYTYL